MSTGIPRAREELFAAHLLSTTGFAAQAVAHAFRAALAAAEAALMLLDRAPPGPEPAAVVAAFVRHVVRERGMEPAAGRQLRSLFNRAQRANANGSVPQPEAPVAIADATEVVDLVAEWIEVSNRVANDRAGGLEPSKQVRRRR